MDVMVNRLSLGAWHTRRVQRNSPWSRESRRERARRQRESLINDPRAARISSGALSAWSVALVPLLINLPDERLPVLGGLALVIFEAAYLMLVRLSVADRGTDEQRAGLLGVLTAIALGAGIGYGGYWLTLFVLLAMAAAVGLPPAMPALLGVAAATVLVTAVGWHVEGVSSYISSAGISGFIVWLLRRLFGVIAMLQQVREELAVTAVQSERLRFARDLHDLLGHTLSLIVVKSEVVRRVAHTDPDAAAREAADIETVGRTALAEIRQAVSGYREQGLTAELDQARHSLTAASITATVRTSGAPYPREADSVLGWVVREGVTNVIRHSHARRCDIEVRREGDEIIATVDDDGVGGSTDLERGNGLSGLAERTVAVGGRLDVRPRRWRGFRLEVAVPAERGET
jgi:two-component system sensor histidine kinase DesK